VYGALAKTSPPLKSSRRTTLMASEFTSFSFNLKLNTPVPFPISFGGSASMWTQPRGGPGRRDPILNKVGTKPHSEDAWPRKYHWPEPQCPRRGIESSTYRNLCASVNLQTFTADEGIRLHATTEARGVVRGNRYRWPG
jgi:hypothetical protein